MNICVVFYGWHDEVSDSKILKLKPDLLVDNTPAGFWQSNCDSKKFQSEGIKVFSYITSDYSDTGRKDGSGDLQRNLDRIFAIKNEGTYGVFLDECEPWPDDYLLKVSAKCASLNLKLMLNPGMPYIDAAMFDIADYILTDEEYEGRAPGLSEIGHLDKAVVIGYDPVYTPAQAAAFSNTAIKYGFSHTWHEQVEYTKLPEQAWLDEYQSLLVQSTPPSPLKVKLTRCFTDKSASTSRRWDFGDGKTSIAKSPQHTYAKQGIYVVTLRNTIGTFYVQVEVK